VRLIDLIGRAGDGVGHCVVILLVALLAGLLAFCAMPWHKAAAFSQGEDEELGSMGKPVVFVHQGLEIKLCCKGCRKDFNKDPEKYLKKLAPKK